MTLLKVANLWMSFGGLHAVCDVSFEVRAGELVGIIGPNGAGKSTLFNTLAGLYIPSRGKRFFEGKDVTTLKAHHMARRGIARTFQIYMATGDLTVVENIMVGSFMHTNSRAKARAKAQELMEMMHLSDLGSERVANLPVAAQKRVVMATALATNPKLLLLDEVAAGLNPAEIDEMVSMIRWVHDELKITVMLIEHVMELVINLSHRVLVLDSGRVIADGDPADVVRRPEVIKAYLGERYAAQFLAEGLGSEPSVVR